MSLHYVNLIFSRTCISLAADCYADTLFPKYEERRRKYVRDLSNNADVNRGEREVRPRARVFSRQARPPCALHAVRYVDARSNLVRLSGFLYFISLSPPWPSFIDWIVESFFLKGKPILFTYTLLEAFLISVCSSDESS